MTLQQLIFFREAAKTQHFTQAAQNLFVVQSTLSHSIQDLENELGIPLFVRNSKKKISLSHYGKEFLDYVEKALGTIDDGVGAIQKMSNPLSGIVRIGFSFLNGYSLLPQIMNELYQEVDRDEISVQIITNTSSDRGEDRLIRGDFDLALTCHDGNFDVETKHIFNQKLYLFVAADHPLASEEVVHLQDVQHLPLIGYRSATIDGWSERIFEECGIKICVDTYAPDWSSQISYVAMGMGMALLPRVPYDPRYVACLEIDHPAPARYLSLSWPRNRKLNSASEFVRDFILDYCEERIDPETGAFWI